MSLMACGQKNNSSGVDNSSKSNTNQFANSTESSVTESAKTKTHSVENAVKNKEKHTQQESKKEVTEKEYYDLIKEAWQKQKDYLDSIDDPKVKQSVQTTNSAAISKSNELLMEHPEDSKAINASLKKVLHGQ
ncbi:hypothetical protein [Clostridium tarantellae]|uniref:Uncharacterized protein n=1 Tax=Clostridium tarantellae TaxID=39493 RepID=A0A6I1MRC1_9CLOT|nr:hypothetical protein [Clostridium tarantellae]MPQ44727.1 hypothetical protein [Clostridium tarantellae]